MMSVEQWHKWDRREGVQSFGGKAQRKETTWKTEAQRCRMGSKWILGRFAGRVWSGYTWLRIGTGDKLL
jgi:hypothetical protein